MFKTSILLFLYWGGRQPLGKALMTQGMSDFYWVQQISVWFSTDFCGLLLAFHWHLLTNYLHWLSTDLYWLSIDIYWISTDFYWHSRFLLLSSQSNTKDRLPDEVLEMLAHLKNTLSKLCQWMHLGRFAKKLFCVPLQKLGILDVLPAKTFFVSIVSPLAKTSRPNFLLLHDISSHFRKFPEICL